MHCPKCNHTQSATVECEACGLIFARYTMVQERKKTEAQEKNEMKMKQAGSGIRLTHVIALILVAVSATYFYTTRSPSDIPQPPDVAVESSSTPSATVTTAAVAKTKNTQRSTSPRHSTTIASATRATVTLQTPFGSGSGFFIHDEWIVTNRHVIEVDHKKVQEARTQYETARKYTDLEKDKLQGYRAKLHSLPQGPAKSQLAMIIEHGEIELEKALANLQGVEEKLNRLELPIHASDIKIILVDGSEYYANYLYTSDNYDLALLSLFADNHERLSRPPAGRSLRQGDKVYTIGSPVGLRHTVTSGIFSGYRERTEDGHLLLQTDAPINPGNSGGPLIDERGFVHGINTSILANTEGIGFAIPIDAVFEEFASTIQ